jgi:lipopolysaccharide transport system ATP-binding protein
MSDITIKVEGLGKRYKIGRLQKRHDTLRDRIADTRLFNLFKRRNGHFPTHHSSLITHHSDSSDILWALKDVSFEVKRGEIVGIIGRNGAGKSTLLKILARITEPTEGYADINGRVGSLLEVGTGFHPELTGRENIYLNGSILGMKRAEIQSKFDEIVAFAEIEKFIDTPVKYYSSGMYVRLAFAVAAHLEPEILVVDEVLSVGDAAFQQKCLGKMGDVAKEGRTVLFVSHNMSVVQHLCSRAFLMQEGLIINSGKPSEIICDYLSDALTGRNIALEHRKDRTTSGEARIMALDIQGDDPVAAVAVGGTLRVTLRIQFREPQVDPTFGVVIHNSLGEPLLDVRSVHDGLRVGRVVGDLEVGLVIRNLGLYPGRYLLSPWVGNSASTRDFDVLLLCCALDVNPSPGPHGDLKLDPTWGKYHINSSWEFRQGDCGSLGVTT